MRLGISVKEGTVRWSSVFSISELPEIIVYRQASLGIINTAKHLAPPLPPPPPLGDVCYLPQIHPEGRQAGSAG